MAMQQRVLCLRPRYASDSSAASDRAARDEILRRPVPFSTPPLALFCFRTTGLGNSPWFRFGRDPAGILLSGCAVLPQGCTTGLPTLYGTVLSIDARLCRSIVI